LIISATSKRYSSATEVLRDLKGKTSQPQPVPPVPPVTLQSLKSGFWGLFNKPKSTPVQSSNTTIKSSIPTIKSAMIKSAMGVDYTRLHDLLVEGKWKEADKETGRVMCQAAGRTNYRLVRDNFLVR
jgi:hypothetical protein